MHKRLNVLALRLLSAFIPFLVAHTVNAQAADAQDIGLNPTRPTVANSGTIQNPGVLQVELGYDAYPQRVPGNQQTVDTLLTYAALPRLRLDFDWSLFNHQQNGNDVASGIGTTQAGGKVELWKEDYHRPAPGIAVQYEAEFPTATQSALQNFGQQATLLINHHYGPNGDLDVIANGSVVQAGCPFGSQPGSHCSYGGQQSVALSYHLQLRTRLYAEVFAQNTSQSNTPPGTYVFAGFFHRFGDTFGLDGGLRFGVSDHSASIGTTVGIVFGQKLQKQPAPSNKARTRQLKLVSF